MADLLSIASFNVNGLRSLTSRTPLPNLLAQLGDVDVLCLQVGLLGFATSGPS
jgi:exonuclease III